MAVDLHVEVVGEGPPVLVLHGLFGAGRNWQTVARALATEYAFHLIDLRNHGASPHTDTMTYLDMVADLELLVARLGLDRFVLVGHSMGGKAAMTMALTAPRGIERVVAVDIAPIAYPDRFIDMIEAMQAIDLTRIARRAEAEAALAAAMPDRTVRLFVLQNLVFEQGRPRWRLNLPTLARDLPQVLGQLPVTGDARFAGPVRFIRGELSDRVTAAAMPLIGRLFPDHRVDTVAGGGHWPHAEAPAPFLQLFSRALAD